MPYSLAVGGSGTCTVPIVPIMTPVLRATIVHLLAALGVHNKGMHQPQFLSQPVAPVVQPKRAIPFQAQRCWDIFY